MAIHSIVGFDELYHRDESLAEHQLDFDSWTLLISHAENNYSDDIGKLSWVYDSFLSKFPLCCGYWTKYAAHKARLSSVEDIVDVYERAVETASFSVDIWVDYCSFAISVFEDPLDVSRLFRRGLSFIGKDYLCHALWDKYIEFEFSQKQWQSLSQIYIEVLKFPTKKLHQYYDSFKKLITIWEEGTGCQGDSVVKLHPETRLDEEFTAPEKDEVSNVIADLMEPLTRSEALKKYINIGELLYQRASQLDIKIDRFEKKILRTYFHLMPLDDDQLENWHHYLDFVELYGNFDWAVKLYERCLIPCASYSEFWMRYVEYVESKGGREIANDALERVTQIFLKDLPAIHLFNAGFKEQIGDICGARSAFLHLDTHTESSFIDYVMRRANMEKRLGNNVAAFGVYKEALAVADKEMLHALPILYIQFSRLHYLVSNSVDASRDILIDGIQNVASCKKLLEELINFAVNHEGARQISILDPIVADVIVPRSDVSGGLSYKDKLDISELYLKFIDLCGNIHDSRRAWDRHVKLFSHSSRADSKCTQPVRASSREILSDGTYGTTSVNPKDMTRDEMNPLIPLSADNAENLKDVPDHANTKNLQDVPDEEGNCKEDEESCPPLCEVNISHMENDKNENIFDIEKEQVCVSGGDEPNSLKMLSLNEPVSESPSLGTTVDHVCQYNQEASPSNSMLDCEQNSKHQPGSILSNVDANSSGQRYCQSPANVQSSQDQKDPDSHHRSVKRKNPMKYLEEQKHKESSLPSPRHGLEGKHDKGRSWMEGQGGEQSQSPCQRDERGVESTSDGNRQDGPVYYDNPKSQRGKRRRNESRGRGAYYARRERNMQFTSTPQILAPSQSSSYTSGQYPTPQQSNEQHANMQSNHAYNLMWQYYYHQQQWQQQQQSDPNHQQQLGQPPQQQPHSESQQELQSQANQMQLLQFQYQYQQQMQQLYQVQQADEHVELQAQQQQIQMQFQQQMQSYQYQQHYSLYLQQLQQLQQQSAGRPLQVQQLLSAGNEEQNELHLQQLPEMPHQQQDGDQENGGAASA